MKGIIILLLIVILKLCIVTSLSLILQDKQSYNIIARYKNIESDIVNNNNIDINDYDNSDDNNNQDILLNNPNNINDNSYRLNQFNQMKFSNNKNNNINTSDDKYINPLLRQASSATVGLVLALLIWRTFIAHEMADLFPSGSLRMLSRPPVILILLLDISGFLINIIRPSYYKNQLKMILATNVLREIIEMFYNIFMIVFAPLSKELPREYYLGRFIANIWWSCLIISISRTRWTLGYKNPQRF